MINNYCNQENDNYVERRETLAADQVVSDLSEEQLKELLEQLTDHNLPDSEKCPLARRLNAENAAKDESDLVISRFCKSSTAANTSSSNSCRNRKSRFQRSGSKDAEFTKDKNNGSNVKAVHSSQSLQDLMISANSDTETMRAIGANRSGKRLNKASRANSFTMPSGSQHFCNNNNNNNSKETFGEVLSTTELRTNSQQTQHSSKGTRNKSVKSRPTSHTSSASVNENSLKSDDESVVSDAPISSRSVHECYATRSVHTDNHLMDSCDNNCTPLSNSSAPTVEQQVCEFEMKDLRKKVNIIEYTSDRNSSVDSFMEFGLRANQKDVIKTNIAERVVNHNCDSDSKDFIHNMSEENRLTQFQGAEAIRAYDQTNCTNQYQESDLASIQQHQQSSIRDNQIRNPNNIKKKKRTDSGVKLSEDIEGHIGFKDVEYLEAFVNSNDSTKQLTDNNSKNALFMTNTNVKNESIKKKEKSIQMLTNSVSNKRKNGSNSTISSSATQKNSVSPNIPLSTSSSSFSSDEANSVSKHSYFAQRTDSLTNETTSPLNSSSDSKNKIQLSRENSDNLDDEKLHQSFNSSFNSLITSNMSADLLYTASDSEMADREKGFVTPKSKHLKRRRGLLRRTENQRNQNCSSVQSSTSTTPSSSTVSGTAGHYTSGQFERFGGMRGYESEREYTEDYRRKQNISSYSRRKSLSSVPHSEQNSAYNSDGELSSHSMPVRNDSINTEKSNSDSRTTPSSISSTPKASYADIAKHLNFGLKRSSVDAIYVTNTMIGSLPVQYQDFPQLDLSLTPVADVSTPSSPNNSKIIEALVSPQQKSVTEKRDLISDSYSAPTSMTNTPLPQTVAQNECLFSETVKNINTDSKSDEISGESEVSTVPAVIMCDYSESVPFTDIGSVTFGFFEDLSTSSEQNTNKTETHLNTNESSEQKASKSAIKTLKTSPELKSHVNTNGPKLSAVQLKYIDGDKKSFNYEHIISFIKKAWDNAKHEHCCESYESSPKVN